MSAAIDAVRELLTLTENVRGLREDVIRMATEMKDLRERLVRLEAREELVVEKTRNAAIVAVTGVNGDLLERLIALESVVGPSHEPGLKKPSRRRKQLVAAPDQLEHTTASTRS